MSDRAILFRPSAYAENNDCFLAAIPRRSYLMLLAPDRPDQCKPIFLLTCIVPPIP